MSRSYDGDCSDTRPSLLVLLDPDPDSYTPGEYDAEYKRSVNRYIAHEDPALNPDPQIFTLLPNPFDIESPFLFPTPTINRTTDYTIFKSACLRRDLSALPPEISPHASPFFPLEIHQTPEFLSALALYNTTHRCIDAKRAFLLHEQSLLHETRLQHELRSGAAASRAEAEDWLDWFEDHDTLVAEAKRCLKAELRADEARQAVWPQPGRKCSSCREADRRDAERAKVRARDPWLARARDAELGRGKWVPEAGFGMGECRSEELQRRDGLIEWARGNLYRFEAARMEREKFLEPFVGDAWYARP